MVDLSLNLDDFTLGDLEEIEEHTGFSVVDAGAGNMPLKALVYMVYVQNRRDDTAYTLDAARDLVDEAERMDDFEAKVADLSQEFARATRRLRFLAWDFGRLVGKDV